MDDDGGKRAAIVLLVIALLLVIAFFVVFMVFFYDAEETSDIRPDFTIDVETGGTWGEDAAVDFFYNGEYGNAIAPYCEGSYDFTVENKTTESMSFEINLTEDENNEYEIPMKYRIKQDGTYVFGTEGYERITADPECTDLEIDGSSSSKFIIEWYWDGDVDDVADTLAGTSGEVYTLNISLTGWMTGDDSPDRSYGFDR
ncbi:MAG: hypothetical protein LUD72_11620 [Bacteroidales bacterium]|nr:hypothetical protein [Bacteroidales bacterium]